MNRIILIGNGFDLAHGLKTSYADFIDWYWEKKIFELKNEKWDILDDGLTKFELLKNNSWHCFYDYVWGNKIISKDKLFEYIHNNPDFFEVRHHSFFNQIYKEYEKKGWVDIENEYYNLLISSNAPQKLNNELDIVKGKLIEYLKGIQNGAETIDELKPKIIEPIKTEDIAVGAYNTFINIINSRLNDENLNGLIESYRDFYNNYKINHVYHYNIKNIIDFKKSIKQINSFDDLETCCYFPEELLLPDRIMLLNFNYTDIADKYFQEPSNRFIVNHIHGKLDNPNEVIFGYGDEESKYFMELKERDNTEYTRNFKTIKYLEMPSYKKLLAFMESAPYQIYIMGHSCGKSDGTLLNTMFEHPNCISIKPFYHQKEDGTDDNWDIVQNIYRNFKDLKLMRDRVVNKTQCEPMPQAE
ncbi:MAG: hypothetical protein IK025_00635 [Bacteroidales bacterium]|nr:hypothetical protein [Bacteroidales bacterium]